MCDVPESTIQELLLSALVSPEYKGRGAVHEDLLRVAVGQRACIVHSLCALRQLLRNGHVAFDAQNGSQDPVSDPNTRWRIAPTPAGNAEGPGDDGRRRLGNYTYSPSELLGRGRLGFVVRGRNDFLRRDVAIKFLQRDCTDNENFRQKFEREARILARLDHPHIVKVYDGGRDSDGSYYIAMEYVEGGTLVHLTKKSGRLPAPLVAEYMRQIADALAVAHRHGIQHRDVKPDNVMMTPSGAKLADFNLAAIEESAVQEAPSAFESVASDLGNAPRLVGTLPYIAPERANRKRGDHRADIYSLGATFYTAAAGGYLFEGLGTGPESYMDWLWHHEKATPKPLTDRVPEFPADLASVIHKCLEKDPGLRYPAYEELIAELDPVRRRLGAATGDASSTDSLPGAVGPTRARLRKRILITIPLVLALTAGVILWLANDPAGKGPPPPANGEGPRAAAPPDRREANAARPSPGNGPTETPPGAGTIAPPKGEPDPKPKDLVESLSAYHPNEAEVSSVRELLDLLATHRAALRSRSYESLLSQLRETERTRFTPAGPEKPYVLRHLEALRELALLAQGVERTGWEEISSRTDVVSLRLSDGSAASGKIERRDANSLTLKDDKGTQVAIERARISSEEFLARAMPGRSRLAFQALSVDAGNALTQVLGLEAQPGDTVLWIPVLVRLARLEAETEVRLSALEAKAELPLIPSGEEVSSRLKHYAGAVSRLRALRESQSRATSIYAFLEAEFTAAGREEEALQALVARRYSHVLAAYEKTVAWTAAADLLLGGFEDELKKAHEELITGIGWSDLNWDLRPDEPDAKKSFQYFDVDPREDTVFLRDIQGPRHLIMQDDRTRAREGLLIRVRFEPAGAPAASPHWRFVLTGERGGSTYLRFDESAVSLCRPNFEPDASDATVLAAKLPAPADPKWRTYVLIPGEGHLHVYAEGNPILAVPDSEGTIPAHLVLTVVRGKVTFKNIQAKRPPWLPPKKHD